MNAQPILLTRSSKLTFLIKIFFSPVFLTVKLIFSFLNKNYWKLLRWVDSLVSIERLPKKAD